MIEKKANERSIKVFDSELGGHFAEPFFSKTQKQAEAISISRDGMRARLPLAKQAIGKEGLEKRRKAGGNHGCASRWISRSIVSCMSSGTASRYQQVSFTWTCTTQMSI